MPFLKLLAANFTTKTFSLKMYDLLYMYICHFTFVLLSCQKLNLSYPHPHRHAVENITVSEREILEMRPDQDGVRVLADG